MQQSKNAIIAALILTLMILMVYWPLQHHAFLNFDDQVYVTDNLRVQSGLIWDNVIWAFRSLDAGFWHPVTWLSLMLDSSLYRMNAGGFHWTNLLLHIGGTLLLFLAWRRMTGMAWQSGFVAALFAIHPLNVEPVAWIASRKDMLSGFFWMLTLFTYARYAEAPSAKRYFVVVLSFVLGIMSKPMLLTMPIILLLLDYWPLLRFKTVAGWKNNLALLILEKVPLALLALALTVVTFIAEHRFGAISDIETFSLTSRISNALVSYVLYMEKMLLPMGLAAYYPHPGGWPLWMTIGAGLLILLVTAMAIRRIKTSPYLFVGWFWYLITLLPVIGIVQIGTFARADRYAYIPLIGLFIAVVYGVAEFSEKLKHRQSLSLSLALAVLIVFMVTSRLQVTHWQNGLTLFQHAVNVTEGNYKAYHGLGMAYHQMGSNVLAIKNIRHSLSLKTDSRAHIDLGVVYMGMMEFQKAEKEFKAGLKLRPGSAKAYNNIGAALASQGKYDEAIPMFQEAVRLDPGYETARLNLKNATDGRALGEGLNSSEKN